MKVFHNIKEIPFFENTIITIGTFDGVHLGHQEMIRVLLRTAEQNRSRSLLITFDPHPLKVLGDRSKPVSLLTIRDEREPIFQALHLDNVFFMPFHREIASLTASQFIQDLLMKQIGLRSLVVGFNNTLGHDRKGNSNALREIGRQLGFSVQHVNPVIVKDQTVSSTLIREALRRGEVRHAQEWLGRPYSMHGRVIRGRGIGRKLGFPTANLDVAEDKLVPKDGVYAVLIQFESRSYTGLANIGYAPTLPGKSYGIEIYIDNFSEIIYNNSLEIKFIGYLREERKFESSEAMIEQIKKDQKKAQPLLAPYIRR